MTQPTMLIVDDVELHRHELASPFVERFTIKYAADGNEAVHIVEDLGDCIAIILLDIIMPKMDGIDFLKWLSQSLYSNIPVIAITAESQYQTEAMKNGAWDFIVKPLEQSILLARVNNVLERRDYLQEKTLKIPMEKTTDGCIVHTVFQDLSPKTKLYQRMLDKTQTAVYACNKDTYDILYFNQQMEKAAGADSTYAIGKKCYQYFFNKDSPCSFCHMNSMKHDIMLEREFTD